MYLVLKMAFIFLNLQRQFCFNCAASFITFFYMSLGGAIKQNVVWTTGPIPRNNCNIYAACNIYCKNVREVTKKVTLSNSKLFVHSRQQHVDQCKTGGIVYWAFLIEF